MKRGEIIAAALALALSVPVVFVFGKALADGFRRYEEAPIRALVGDDTFDAFARGETPAQHYVGDDRLAPDVSLRTRSGSTWRLADQRGKVVVMNFWTITCQPCVEEMPSFTALARAIGRDPGVELVAVSVDRNWDALSPVLGPTGVLGELDALERGGMLHVLFDPQREIVHGKFGTRLFPETWVIDREGVIRLRVDGARDWSSPVVHDMIRALR